MSAWKQTTVCSLHKILLHPTVKQPQQQHLANNAFIEVVARWLNSTIKGKKEVNLFFIVVPHIKVLMHGSHRFTCN